MAAAVAVATDGLVAAGEHTSDSPTPSRRYCDMATEINTVLTQAYSHRPGPDAFLARTKTVRRTSPRGVDGTR